MKRLVFLALGLAVACSDDDATLSGATPDSADVLDAVADAASLGSDTTTADSDADDATAPPAATGTLRILHLDLPAGVALAMGQSTLVVGPDGTTVLIDVGNGSHDDEIRAAVEHLNTQILTPANGFAPRGARQVEWVILTHLHGDHIGGFADLLLGKKALTLTRGIVHRGPVDLGKGANDGDWRPMCVALAGDLKSLHHPLCHAAVAAPCDAGNWSGNYPALDCPELLRGDLATTADDAQGQPTFLDLGGGARLTLHTADGFVSDGKTLQQVTFGHGDSNEENARSIGGWIAHGPFRYHFGGDLSGSGKDNEPDVETRVAQRALAAFLGPLGADVSHLHHHGRNTSSNATLVQALAPDDGLTRNTVVSLNNSHLGSPHPSVVHRWTDSGRLGAGQLWCLEEAPGGAEAKDFPALLVADATVAVETLQGGTRYRIGPWEASGGAEFASVRTVGR